jgi:hypothetical protein
MDRTKLKQFLYEVAEVEELKPKKLATLKQDDDEINQVLYQGQHIELNIKQNPTLGIKIKGLKPIVKECQLGCGQSIANQRIEFKHYGYPEPHWRTRCDNCQKYVSPCGEFLIDNASTFNAAYIKWVNARKK